MQPPLFDFWKKFWYNFLVKVIAGMIFSISPKRQKGQHLRLSQFFMLFYLRPASIFILVLLAFICASGEKLS